MGRNWGVGANFVLISGFFFFITLANTWTRFPRRVGAVSAAADIDGAPACHSDGIRETVDDRSDTLCQAGA